MSLHTRRNRKNLVSNDNPSIDQQCLHVDVEVNQSSSLNRGSLVLVSVTPSRNVGIQVGWGIISGVKGPWVSSLTSSSKRYCTPNVVTLNCVKRVPRKSLYYTESPTCTPQYPQTSDTCPSEKIVCPWQKQLSFLVKSVCPFPRHGCSGITSYNEIHRSVDTTSHRRQVVFCPMYVFLYVKQPFPWQLLFQCWDPYDILLWTFHTDPFCLNKHTQGKKPGHSVL